MNGLIVFVLFALFIAGIAIFLAVLLLIRNGNQQGPQIQHSREFPQDKEDVPQSDSGVSVFADLPNSTFDFSMKNAKEVSMEDAISIAVEVFDNPEGSFFGLEQGKRIVQFVNENRNTVTVDVPVVAQGGAYQKTLTSTSEIVDIIEAFYAGKHIVSLFDLEFVRR